MCCSAWISRWRRRTGYIAAWIGFWSISRNCSSICKSGGRICSMRSDVLLYDLTSTYVEGEAELNPKAKRGYSPDGRPDCKQVASGTGDHAGGVSSGL